VTGLEKLTRGRGLPHVVLFRVRGRPSAATSQPQPPRAGDVSAPLRQEIMPPPDVSVENIIAGNVPVTDAVRHFQLGRSSFPIAAQMKGKHLKEMRIHSFWKKAPMVIAGISNRCRRRHRQLLWDFQKAIVPAWEELPLGDAALQFISATKQRGKRKSWSESAALRSMTALAGALSQMPMYSDFPTAINLSDCAVWKTALHCHEIRAKMAEPVNQPAMDYAAVNTAVHAAMAANTLQAAVAIMLTWLCAGRVGDATQFRKEDFTFSCISETTGFQRVRIIVRRGKAAKLAQPHTIDSIVPPQWMQIVRKLFATVCRGRTARHGNGVTSPRASAGCFGRGASSSSQCRASSPCCASSARSARRRCNRSSTCGSPAGAPTTRCLRHRSGASPRTSATRLHPCCSVGQTWCWRTRRVSSSRYSTRRSRSSATRRRWGWSCCSLHPATDEPFAYSEPFF
jgi:hypothetical protein